MKVDFATFCYAGDAHRLHYNNQIITQVLSNEYLFNRVLVVYQKINWQDYELLGPGINPFSVSSLRIIDEQHIDDILRHYHIDIAKKQYESDTDKAHRWRYHCVNHLFAIIHTDADYIVFADNDCWMINNPEPGWITKGIDILKQNPDVFIVSPNDGEPERKTQTMSQQMFLVRVEDFRQADLNQPGWDGNVKNHPELPEYHGMLEGRMHHYCKFTGRYRYVLPPEYRYVHHNRFNEDGTYYTDYKEWGIL